MKLILLITSLVLIGVIIVMSILILTEGYIKKRNFKKKSLIKDKIKPGSTVQFYVRYENRPVFYAQGKVHFIDEKNEMASIKDSKGQAFVVTFDDIKRIIYEAL